MGYLGYLEVLALVLPVVGLLGLGTVVSLRSGVASLGREAGYRQLLGNLYSTLAIVLLLVVALAMIQQLAGFRLAGW